MTITAASAGSTASTTVKFAQPASMKVSIALNPAVEALTSLNFSLINTPGATYTTGTVTALNAASGLFIEAAQVSADTTNVGFFTGSSINTGTTTLVELTYAITSGFLPTVQVTNISARQLSNPSDFLSPTVPVNLTPENFVVKVDYM